MAGKVIPFTFDKDAVWTKVRDRKPVVLDMNCWINMGDDKFPQATQVKATLRRLVSDGTIFCPLSFGLIIELHKQAEDSRLRVGTLMDELSLSVSYASREEIFAWEVERVVRRLAGVGPFDLSLSELYVPVLAFLTSRFRLDFPEGFPSEHIDDAAKLLKEGMERVSLTQFLGMRVGRPGLELSDLFRIIPTPKYSEAAKRTWDKVKGDRRIRRIESEIICQQHILPAMNVLPHDVKASFLAYLDTIPKNRYGDCLGELMSQFPSIHNHMELMAAITQNPTRRDKMNDFFDYEIMSVPLAYASVFVAQDKGIRDVLRNRTKILERTACRYCFDLAELEDWLKADGLA